MPIRHLLPVGLLVAAAAAQAPVADTQFSSPRGLYAAPFPLTISSATAGAFVRYTLDCSDPRTSSTFVEGTAPVTLTIDPQSSNGGRRPLTPAVVVRAFAWKPGMLPTNVDTVTFVFPDRVLVQTRPSGFPTSVSFTMDQSVVTAPAYSGRIRDDLLAIPSMSVVASHGQVFGSGGLLTAGNGSIEVPGSIEIMHPDGRDDQADCGLVPHSWAQAKRALRVYFRASYGDDKWRHDLFRDSVEGGAIDVTSFDDLVLRSGFNDGLLYQEAARQGRYSFAVDELGRSCQIAMSGHGSRGLFVHLYLNGLYWGLYNPCERPESGFLSQQFGGAKSDFFARNHSGVLDGSPTFFDGLITGATNYSTVQARLDVPSFCDYIVYWTFCGGGDWPSYAGHNNNWYAGNRTQPANGRVRFYVWDTEDSWCNLPSRPQAPLDGARLNVELLSGPLEISQLWRGVQANADFRLAFADRIYQQCYNDGPLSEPAILQRWNRIVGRVDHGVVGESARWGRFDPRSVTWTRDNDWLPYVDAIRQMFVANTAQLVAALRNTTLPVAHPRLYPNVEPPWFRIGSQTIDVTEAEVAASTVVALVRNGPSGTIWFTTDGSDPRGANGQPAGQNGGSGISVTVNGPLLLSARTLDTEWSAVHRLRLEVAGSSPLRIAEFLAENTIGLTDPAGDRDDWIELHNRGALPFDASGHWLSDDPAQPLKWALPANTLVPAGGTLLVWADDEAAEGPLHANFKLSGNGESVLLSAPSGALLDRIDFGSQRDDASEGRLHGAPALVVAFERPSPERHNRPEPSGHIRYQARTAADNPLRLRGKGVPMPGELLQYEVEDLPAGAPALLGLGFLPQHAPVPGLGTLLVQPLLTVFALADADGEAKFAIALPDTAPARNAVLYAQAGASVQGLLQLSNGICSRTCW